ncbi:MAG: 30S ribosomal protein S15 [Nanoarchaeota archaeon]|nr:30S ribosomal protein S15 [Nanoarchaeota archaeon]
MSRQHSHKRGQSGSTKPIKKVIPSWVKYKPKEVELLITKYGKEGKQPSKIGILLRDEYGIPDAKMVTGKTINQILKDKKLAKDIPEALLALIQRSLAIRKHLEANKHDQPARLGLTLTDNKINRLVKYYKKQKILPADWKYDPSRARIYLG